MKRTIIMILVILSLILVTSDCSNTQAIEKEKIQDPKKGKD